MLLYVDNAICRFQVLCDLENEHDSPIILKDPSGWNLSECTSKYLSEWGKIKGRESR